MKQSSAKGFAVLSSASVICKLLSLVYLPFQTWVVGDVGNGIINIGFTLYLFIYQMTNAGLPLVISKFVSENLARGDYRSAQRTFRSAFTVMMSTSVISAALTFGCAGWVATVYSHTPQAAMMLRTIAPTFLFTAVSCSLRGYYQGHHDMKPTAVSQVIEQLLNTVFTVVFILLFSNYAVRIHADRLAYSAAGFAVGTLLGAAGSAVYLVFLYFHVGREKRAEALRGQTYDAPVIGTFEIYRLLIVYSVPAVINVIASSAVSMIDVNSCTWMMELGGRTVQQATALYGIYSTKYLRLMTLATMFAAPLVTWMIPSISAALVRGDRKYFRYKINESYKLVSIITMPVVAGLTFLAQPILTVIFIHRNAGADVVAFGTWVAILSIVQTIQAGVLMAMGHPLLPPVTTLAGIAAKVACNYLLIRVPAINIYGAIAGNALSWLIAIVLNQMIIRHYAGRRLRFMRYMVVSGVASVLMGVFCFGLFHGLFALAGLVLPGGVLVSDICTLITAAVGALFYFTLMIKTGGVKTDDLRKLPMGSRLYALLVRVPFLRRDLAVGKGERT